MRPYWVTFDGLEDFHPLGLGVGVTAHDSCDAEIIVAEAFGSVKILNVSVVEDMATLEKGHVRPNMGSIFIRGIWFPLGHDAIGDLRKP